ncbi:hypothetical protein ABT160_44305 [Streptomyces sp. NPDC001941]|uniref:hypothetical protein n=1 Tax=Streptomyces sp. NPDC001941 TaxID=3154659 RepID=UPI0033200DE9
MHVKATATAATAVLLLLATGCAGSGPEPGRETGKSRDRADTPAARERKLQRAALAPGDLPGYQVSDARAPAATGRPRADRRQCQPLADAMGDRPGAGAVATAARGIGSQKDLGLAVSASVSTYSTTAARTLMAELRAAVAACGAGFNATLQGRSGHYADVRTAPYRTRGEDTVSWTTTGATQGIRAPLHLVVVRQGATVVRFMALDIADRATPRVPQEVADKQLEKVSRHF